MYGVGITTFPILYLDTNEIQPLMAALNLKLVQGRLPQPQSCEIITNWQLAANWGIKPGSRLPRSKFRLVGCFDGKPLLGLGNLDRFLSTQHLTDDQLNLLLIPKRGQVGQVKQYLTQLKQTNPELFTSTQVEQSCHEDINELDLIFNLVYATITGIVCLCVCFLYYLYFWQRRPELGMLEAIGHTPQRLVYRALTEILGINLFAFAFGVITAYLGGWALNHLVLTRHGLPLVLWDPGYPSKLLPLPFLVTGISLIPVWRMLTQVDPVAMIEGEI